MVVEGSGQPGQRVALAVDIGGTKLVVGVVDEAARVLWSTRCPTPGADGELMYSTLASMLDEAAAAAPARPVVCGVGCGGPMEPGGRMVSPLNITGWRGFPLLQRRAAARRGPDGRQRLHDGLRRLLPLLHPAGPRAARLHAHSRPGRAVPVPKRYEYPARALPGPGLRRSTT